MKKVLITGISGFAGSFLADYLLSSGKYSISGTYHSDTNIANINHLKDKITLIGVNLLDEKLVENIYKELAPDIIFHLAALTSPSESFASPLNTLQNNIASELAVLEAVRKGSSKSKILIVSTSEIYGMVEEKDLPIDENTPLRPVSPYAVSKIAQDYLGLQYKIAYNLHVVRVRPFVHIGPRQSPKFVTASFAKQIAEIEKGKKEPILLVGNLKAKRDFTDVRDMVRAYEMVVEKGQAGEVYNIGSGTSFEIAGILQKLLSFSKNKISIQVDKSLVRPSDIPELICDGRKLSRQTGWKPEIPIDTTLKDILDYWRNII